MHDEGCDTTFAEGQKILCAHAMCICVFLILIPNTVRHCTERNMDGIYALIYIVRQKLNDFVFWEEKNQEEDRQVE